MLSTALGLLAASWAVVMAFRPVLQIREILKGTHPPVCRSATSPCFSSASGSGSLMALPATISDLLFPTRSRSWSCASPSARSFGIDREMPWDAARPGVTFANYTIHRVVEPWSLRVLETRDEQETGYRETHATAASCRPATRADQRLVRQDGASMEPSGRTVVGDWL